MIENCRNAKEILADTIVENVVENIGDINSEFSEYVPVISADETVMIYTYRGDKSVGADDVKNAVGSDKYNEDVFITYKKDGVWTEPKSIGENINTKEHDAAIALSVDGQTLFIYKTDVYINTPLFCIYTQRYTHTHLIYTYTYRHMGAIHCYVYVHTLFDYIGTYIYVD